MAYRAAPKDAPEISDKALLLWVRAVSGRLRWFEIMAEPGRQLDRWNREKLAGNDALEELVDRMQAAAAAPGVIQAAARAMLEERGLERYVADVDKSFAAIAAGYTPSGR